MRRKSQPVKAGCHVPKCCTTQTEWRKSVPVFLTKLVPHSTIRVNAQWGTLDSNERSSGFQSDALSMYPFPVPPNSYSGSRSRF